MVPVGVVVQIMREVGSVCIRLDVMDVDVVVGVGIDEDDGVDFELLASVLLLSLLCIALLLSMLILLLPTVLFEYCHCCYHCC